MVCYLDLLLQLFLQFFNDYVLVVIQKRQVLDVHRRIFKLFVQIENLAFHVVHDDELWIDILCW